MLRFLSAFATALCAVQVRYREGVAVRLGKGEKYVVEKVGEEWDGGSRGKVFTKGKRGKGFS